MARFVFVNAGRGVVKRVDERTLVIEDGALARSLIPAGRLMPLVIYDVVSGAREIVYAENVAFIGGEGVFTILRAQEGTIEVDFAVNAPPGTVEAPSPNVFAENFPTARGLGALSAEFEENLIQRGGFQNLTLGAIERPWAAVFAHRLISGGRELVWSEASQGRSLRVVLPDGGTIATLADIRPDTGVFSNPVSSGDGEVQTDYPLTGGAVGDRAWILQWNPGGRSFILAASVADMRLVLNNPGDPIPSSISIPAPFSATIENVEVGELQDFRIIAFDTPPVPASLALLREYLASITPPGQYTPASLLAARYVVGAHLHGASTITGPSGLFDGLVVGYEEGGGTLTVRGTATVSGDADIGGDLSVGGVKVSVGDGPAEDAPAGAPNYFLRGAGNEDNEADEGDGAKVIATQKFTKDQIASNVTPFATFLSAGAAAPTAADLYTVPGGLPDINLNRQYLYRIGHRFIRGCDEWIVAPSETAAADDNSANNRQQVRQIRGSVLIFSQSGTPEQNATIDIDGDLDISDYCALYVYGESRESQINNIDLGSPISALVSVFVNGVPIYMNRNLRTVILTYSNARQISINTENPSSFYVGSIYGVF